MARLRTESARLLRRLGLRQAPSPQGSELSPPRNASDEELLRWNHDFCSWPGLYYSSLREFLRGCGVTSVAEIGVAYGYHAESLITGLPDVEYVGIDPYLPGYDDSDSFVRDVGRLFGTDPESAMDRLFGAVRDRISHVSNGRGRIIRMHSVEAAARFEDGRFDAVFVDGDHRYESVLADLRAWWPKVRSGGTMLGDDYDNWPGVARAWDEFIQAEALDHFFVTHPSSGYRTVAVVRRGAPEL